MAGSRSASALRRFATVTRPDYVEFKSRQRAQDRDERLQHRRFPTEDRKGDGDSVNQMRFTGVEAPGGRTMSLLIPRLYEGIAQFFRTCEGWIIRGMAGRGGAFDLREIFYAIASRGCVGQSGGRLRGWIGHHRHRRRRRRRHRGR